MTWENEFKCEGISSLANFSALVNELEELDPVAVAVQSKHRGRPGDVPSSLQKSKVLQLAPRLDALLDLLAATADGLAATWDLMTADGTEAGFKPTVQ